MAVGQISATTGRTRRYPWLDIINAQTPYLSEQQRLLDSRRLDQQQQGTEYVQNRRQLAADREYADQMYQLQQEQDAAAARQAQTSQVISGVGTAASIAAPYAGKIGAAAAPAASKGVSALSGGTGSLAGLGYAALGTADTLGYKSSTGNPIGSPGFATDWVNSASMGLGLTGMGQVRRWLGNENSIGNRALDFMGGRRVNEAIANATGLNRITDWVDDKCIIVSACYGRESFDVDIARMFRDTFLDGQTLRGYYMIAEQVVPLMELFPKFKEHVRRTLVDPMLSLGKSIFGLGGDVTPERLRITERFLSMCAAIGGTVDSYTRKNGEVF